MAQIIASIERMEQEARASGDDGSKTQEPHDWARQGGRGKKGKKGKCLGVKVKAGKKLKVSAGGEEVKATVERKLTPKKRWIQLWSAQLDVTKDKKDCNSSLDGAQNAPPTTVHRHSSFYFGEGRTRTTTMTRVNQGG